MWRRLKIINALFQKSKKIKAAEMASTASESKGLCEASLTAVTLCHYTNLCIISINSVRAPEHLLCLLDGFEYTPQTLAAAAFKPWKLPEITISRCKMQIANLSV